MADVGRSSDEDRLGPVKKLKIDHQPDEAVPIQLTAILNDSSKPEKPRSNGTAPIKKEYLIYNASVQETKPSTDDDAAEAAPHNQEQNQKARVKQGGQNTSRHFGSWRDKFQLCGSRTRAPEFSPGECPFGDKCKFEHDLRKYLNQGKRQDLDSFGTICPVWNVYGSCNEGWKCRWVGSHSKERTIDGKAELVLVEDEDRKAAATAQPQLQTNNNIEVRHKIDLSKRKYKFSKTDRYTKWLEKSGSEGQEDKERLLPSEKRRLYFGPDTPALAPLTTQGNLPFRRLCLDFGAQLTYSEMAISMPLIQGQKSEWALVKAHQLETLPPTVTASSLPPEYDQASDLRFGVQISANKPPIACRATEVLTSLCPHIRLVDLNCGCPIDMVYQNGAGSALMNNQGRLEKIIHGMNAVSGAVPITAKIRMGTANDKPTALKLIKRLYQGGHEAQETSIGPSGVAAITLHGRSRQQRYTKSADWSYIAQCATLIRSLSDSVDATTDTAFAPDPRDLPATNGGRPWFLGNGDCYSHIDYFAHLEDAKVNAVMIGRGALIKPWIFEEVSAGQHLDVSASQRLEYVERYVKYGLETWGSDEIGVGLTRRFLLEWLSFAYRYVPIGLLERLPPNMQDRPPAYRGRNELETLLASDNYKDWIKISEMFLGPAHEDFKFEPKHKSNSYETQAEG